MLRSSCILHLYYWYKKRGILDFWKKWCCVHVAIGTDVVYFEAVWRWSLCYQLSTASEAEAKRVITNWCSELHRGQTNVKSLCTSIWCAFYGLIVLGIYFWRFMKWGLCNFKECNDSDCVFVLVRTMYYIKSVLMQWCKGGRNDLVESDKYMIWLYFL